MRERRLIWAILSLTLIASVFSALQVPRVKADMVTVSITPAHNAYDPGENFTITIDITDVWGLNAWELYVWYNPAYLYTNNSLARKGPFLSQNGFLSTSFLAYNSPAGFIQMCEGFFCYPPPLDRWQRNFSDDNIYRSRLGLLQPKYHRVDVV